MTKFIPAPVHEDCGYDTLCHLWQGAPDRQGYGRIRHREGDLWLSRKAHRAIWEAQNGPVPEGLILDHLCRVRRCVNPDHLEPVTWAENVRRGDAAKLTVEQIGRIRGMFQRGARQCEIAREFGLGSGHVANIISERVWKGIPAT